MPGLLPTTTTGPNLNSRNELLKPGVWTGKLPSTGVVHRLTIDKGMVTVERKPYRSPNADGWTQHYTTLTEKVENHTHLIAQIRANPCDWA